MDDDDDEMEVAKDDSVGEPGFDAVVFVAGFLVVGVIVGVAKNKGPQNTVVVKCVDIFHLANMLSTGIKVVIAQRCVVRAPCLYTTPPREGI